MRTSYLTSIILVFINLSVYAQETDSLTHISLSEIVVNESARHIRGKNITVPVEVVEKEFIRQYFTGNLVQTLENVPGVRSMDIGSGFSKPMIRGMGFNRITVTENGIKQEGQQWGADHGLEIDAFHVEQVMVRKGPSSLLYGSDAMGGVIEISQRPAPLEDQIFGEVSLLGKSVNGTFGGSVMMGLKKERWYSKIRFSEQHYGDYRVPTDTIVYLTQKMPVYNNRLKNTAGYERDINFFSEYRTHAYLSQYTISNTYQKTGFFPGAHGIPDISRLQHDGSYRNIELPYSTVNHFKWISFQQYSWDAITLQWHLAYQNNRRKEWSLFHTHYSTQTAPDTDPDKELDFNLNTLNSSFKVRFTSSAVWDHTGGWDLQQQWNDIAGYSFLLPEYTRFTTGVFWITNYRPTHNLSISGGLRYDYGKVDISPFLDSHLVDYLNEQNYSSELIELYQWRSYPVNRHFKDLSGSLGIVWQPHSSHLIKANIGRSFRLPGANELAANGVHHGTFRHEQGDGDLKSEQGFQLDMGYTFEKNRWSASVNPFISWFENYIFLKPTGEWSILPHAGQVYRYSGAKAIFAGAEVSVETPSWQGVSYHFSGEYVYTHNREEHVPLSFSPPPTMRHTVTWEKSIFRFHVEWHAIVKQDRVAKNEDPTPGANLFHGGISLNLPISKHITEITLSGRNLFNTRYYNHLSFYRKVEIPEPGRNIQITIKVPFKSKI